jgi:hypothetical protein
LSLLALLALLINGTLFATVPWDEVLARVVLLLLLLVPLLGVHGSRSVNTGDALDGGLVTPRGLACVADVALNKLPATPPADEKSKVVHPAAHDNEETEEDRAETRAEALVVVTRAPPLGEAIPHEMVVALALGTLEHVRDDRQPLVASGDLLEVCIDLLLRGALADLDTGRGALLLVGLLVLIDEALAGLVGVETGGLLAVSLVQLVLRCAGLDAEEVVESDIAALCKDNFVADAEDLVICW